MIDERVDYRGHVLSDVRLTHRSAPISNRLCCRLEFAVTACKQTTARDSNRRKSAIYSFLQNAYRGRERRLDSIRSNRNIPRLETHLTRAESTYDPLLIATNAHFANPRFSRASLRLLGREEGGPEGAVVVGYEIGFLGWRRRDERLEIAGQGVEVLPRGDAGTVGRAELGEVGPVVLHGAGELQLRSGEWRARESDGQIEKILNLGRVRRTVGEGDRGEEILRRILVIKLVGGERDELRHRQVRA